MGRSYDMQNAIDIIATSDRIKILREYPDFLITHSYVPPSDSYKIATRIEKPDGKRYWKCMTLSELAMTTCVRKPEKIQQLIDALRKTVYKLVPSSEWRHEILREKDVFYLAEGEYYVAYRKHYGLDKYYIEAPMFGKSAMEDSYPWSTEITKQQAMLFMNNYQLASEYYQKVRYNR